MVVSWRRRLPHETEWEDSHLDFSMFPPLIWAWIFQRLSSSKQILGILLG